MREPTRREFLAVGSIAGAVAVVDSDLSLPSLGGSNFLGGGSGSVGSPYQSAWTIAGTQEVSGTAEVLA